jgi:uncharacterized protein
MSRVAVIGSGIAGLGTAWFLHRHHEVTVFEKDARPGGHAHTVEVREADRAVRIDTGFMVYNPVTYPRLIRLFKALGVPETATDMSFSVQHRPRAIDYSGSSVNHLFAQRRNLFRPSHYRMLMAVNRFNRDAAAAVDDPALRTATLESFVRSGGYGEDFLRLYLVPMASAVWSTPPDKILRFPASTLIRFFHNHGFLGLHTQHAWRTIAGGSREYVERLCRPFRDRIQLDAGVEAVRRKPRGGVEVVTRTGTADFDKVVLACHPPASLALLGSGATPIERRVLGCFAYQNNPTVLHTDRAVMPRTRLAWSSWNYRYDADAQRSPAERVSTHYWMNRLQRVSESQDYFVSLNAEGLVDRSRVLMDLAYEHPLFDRSAIEAQAGVAGLNAGAQGGTETYFAGAWQGYGFHEDGLASAERLAGLLLGGDPWKGAS